MPRYLVERAFDPCTQEELDAAVVRSKRILSSDFRDVTWEHSHVCADADGNVISFCVYAAADEARVREHADQLGGHTIIRVIEIAGDIDPADIVV
jgi:hypothetical protein